MMYYYVLSNAYTQILRTVKEFARLSQPLTVFRSNVPFLGAFRSGLLTFFSSLVIQESLINFAGERLRSKTDSHCESVFYFCLSASYPGVEFVFAEIASTSQPIRTSFLTMLALDWSSGPVLSVHPHILCS